MGQNLMTGLSEAKFIFTRNYETIIQAGIICKKIIL